MEVPVWVKRHWVKRYGEPPIHMTETHIVMIIAYINQLHEHV